MTPSFFIRSCPRRSDPISLRASAVFSFLLSVDKRRSLQTYSDIWAHVQRRA